MRPKIYCLNDSNVFAALLVLQMSLGLRPSSVICLQFSLKTPTATTACWFFDLLLYGFDVPSGTKRSRSPNKMRTEDTFHFGFPLIIKLRNNNSRNFCERMEIIQVSSPSEIILIDGILVSWWLHWICFEHRHGPMSKRKLYDRWTSTQVILSQIDIASHK